MSRMKPRPFFLSILLLLGGSALLISKGEFSESPSSLPLPASVDLSTGSPKPSHAPAWHTASEQSAAEDIPAAKELAFPSLAGEAGFPDVYDPADENNQAVAVAATAGLEAAYAYRKLQLWMLGGQLLATLICGYVQRMYPLQENGDAPSVKTVLKRIAMVGYQLSVRAAFLRFLSQLYAMATQEPPALQETNIGRTPLCPTLVQVCTEEALTFLAARLLATLLMTAVGILHDNSPHLAEGAWRYALLEAFPTSLYALLEAFSSPYFLLLACVS